jgi:hypothetical protein
MEGLDKAGGWYEAGLRPEKSHLHYNLLEGRLPARAAAQRGYEISAVARIAHMKPIRAANQRPLFCENGFALTSVRGFVKRVGEVLRKAR